MNEFKSHSRYEDLYNEMFRDEYFGINNPPSKIEIVDFSDFPQKLLSLNKEKIKVTKLHKLSEVFKKSKEQVKQINSNFSIGVSKFSDSYILSSKSTAKKQVKLSKNLKKHQKYAKITNTLCYIFSDKTTAPLYNDEWLKPKIKKLLLMLESRASINGCDCRWFDEEIASIMQCSVRTVQRMLDFLERKKFIVRFTDVLYDKKTQKFYAVRVIRCIRLYIKNYCVESPSRWTYDSRVQLDRQFFVKNGFIEYIIEEPISLNNQWFYPKFQSNSDFISLNLYSENFELFLDYLFCYKDPVLTIKILGQ